ncbi:MULTISPECIES: TetR family transcriptional regulator [unclassified Nocardioides]|uniref:TetR family transcriptional regulator n=1 Tax=unclassified Nocardioides TaxID=2615069 RepID=UPI000B17F86D|nr:MULTISPECIES: TetR family transcriptional regulator [unclassified Nocardioides]
MTSKAAAVPDKPESRQERKERTRRAILDAALEMLADEGFGSLSLRALTKAAGIVPTAFYRHFSTLDELGLALLDESFMTLRGLIREVRGGDPAPETLIDRSVDVLSVQLEEHKAHFRFIGRERQGGNAVLRDAIRHELSLFERELATDLARMPGLERWGAADLHVLASLFVDLMVAAAGELVGPAADHPATRKELVDNLRNQARMIVVGAAGWEPLDR